MKKILLALLLPGYLYSQTWVDMMLDPSVNFYETQQEFENYWQNKSIEKGKGWKQFKRWENFIAPRVYPDGVIKPEMLYQQYNNLKQTNNQFKMLPPNVWTQVGPDNVPLESSGRKRGIGRVNTVAFHPTDPDIIYVGAPAGGFWKSLDNGQTWNTTTDFATNLGVSDIAINPNNADEVYIITGDRDGGDTYSYGLMKSLDGGSTFITTGLSFNILNGYRGNRVLIDPSNSNTIIVSTSNGIYRSTDAGATFSQTFSGINITDIEFHTTNYNIIYGASNGNTSIYKSTDNGLNWNQSANGLPLSGLSRACVAVTEDNPQVVYALFGASDNGFYGVYKSNDEGNSWSEQSTSPNLLGWSTTGSDNGGQAWYDLAFAVSPNDENTIFVGGVNTWKSTDGGISWDINTHWTGSGGAEYKHADVHMLKYHPLNDFLYSGNDGGLYFTTDEVNWTDISDGLHISQFYSLGVSQTVQDQVITGSQDNGTFLKTNLNWDAVIGGDGMECIIDYTNSNIMYGSIYYGDIRKSTNGGNSFSTISSGNGAWETPYELDKNDPNTIYIGYDELVKSTDGGNSWSTITNNQTNGNRIDEIGLSTTNSNRIYFSDGSDMFRTNDGGNSWTKIDNNGLPNKTITYILVSPNNENIVWVTLSGYTSGEKVFKTYNGGDNWVNISGNLPNIPVNCIEIDKSSSVETVYIGTDLGVFTTDSTLNDWNLFNNNSLPNVIVNELEIQYQSNKLFAATYGRGLWSIDLEITSPPIANFSISDSVFCNVPADVSFLNNSFYSNTYYWDFGDGSTSSSINPTHTYTSYGTFTVELIAIGPLGNDTVVKQQIISIDQNNSCIITLPTSGSGYTQNACTGTLYDVGGPNNNYYDQTDSWITIAPPGSSQITLTFNSFDVEAPSSSTNCNWDYLEIFDGPDTTYSSLGQYCNTLTGSPGTVVSSGGAITVLLHSDQAVNGSGFEADWSCVFPNAPPSSSFEFTDSLSCDGTITFTDLSTNGPTSWLWDFGDGNTSVQQSPSHTYLNSGIYTVKLTTSNSFGIDSVILIDAIQIINMSLQAIGDSSCFSSSLLLNANSSSGLVSWYSDSSLQNLLDTGNIFQTPNLNSTTTYFAQSSYKFDPVFGAPNDNTFGSGSFFQGNRHLVFDNYVPSKLVSVLVYTNSDGNRTIELRNSSNAVLLDTNIFIPASPNGIRLYLNFDLPVQNNMQLGISASNSDMYRNSTGASFPYNISNLVSITGTNASAGYYYFFYDWEVEKASCKSNVVEVIAKIDTNTQNTTNITSCGSYMWPVDSITYTVSGIYTDVSINSLGCTNTEILDLTINNSNSDTSNFSSCVSFYWPVDGNTYTSTGIYTYTIVDSLSGCIQNEILNLTISNNITNTVDVTTCGSYFWLADSNIYTTSGTYSSSFVDAFGCQQTEILNLSLLNDFNFTQNLTICVGDTLHIGSSSYYSPGLYFDVFTTSQGCDSIIYTNLAVQPITTNSQTITLCHGDSVIIGSNTYNNSGIYVDTITSDGACDSILTTNIESSFVNGIIINNNNELEVNVTSGVIENYIWSTGDTSSTTSLVSNGIYWCVMSDINGCTSDTLFYNYFVNSNLNENNLLSIYPNPTNGEINVSFFNNIESNLEIINLLGKIIYRKNINEYGKQIVTIDLSEFSNGIYILELKNEKGIINEKIILK